MKYRQLGSSPLLVSEIAYGSWLTFTDKARRQAAIACVHRALHHGINLIDTANVYGLGAAEEVLGEALRAIKRDSFVLATKLYFPMSKTDKGLSREQISKQLEASLKRLRVEWIDLYQCHRHDAQTPLEETMEALTRAVQSGKVRYIGFSEWPLDRIEAAQAMAGVERFVSSQPQYSLLHRDPEKGLLALSQRLGISQIVWSPLAQGVLTGKYTSGAKAPAGSRAADRQMGAFLNDRLLDAPVLDAVSQIKSLAARAGLTLAQFALAWVLRQPNVAAAIIGATRPEQIDENVIASGAVVDPALFLQAEALLASVNSRG